MRGRWCNVKYVQRSGNSLFPPRLVKENKAALPTPGQQRLIEAGAVIRSDPTDVEATFMARHLVQCTLPHSDPQAALRKVSAVFPGGLKLKWDRNGLTFLPGAPRAVPPGPKER
jgi:hypothetical protein